MAIERIVLEATGGYETAASVALAAVGLPVAVVNPAQVRHFAKTCRVKARTDRIDAQMPARFARQIEPPLRPLPDEAQRELSTLVERRNQLVKIRAQEKTRLATAVPQIRVSLEQHNKQPRAKSMGYYGWC